ncbi:MAG: hypothetical protein Q9191_007931, partial [Dirinaria sp. TL-2023a]
PILHPLLRRIPLLKKHLPSSFRSLFSSRTRIGDGTGRSGRSKKSSQKSTEPGNKDIELAEEGRAIGKKKSQDSGEETLIDSYPNKYFGPGKILRTDQFAVKNEAAEEVERPNRGQRDSPLVYQGLGTYQSSTRIPSSRVSLGE